MFVKIIIIFAFVVTTFGLANAQRKIPIVNAKLAFIPKIKYPEIANSLCAGGIVEVFVEYMSKGGKAISAKAISGDEFLRESAVKAVRNARFSSMNDVLNFKMNGIVVLNFNSFVKRKCIEVGVLNNGAKNLPKPNINLDINISKETEIRVRVLIDFFEGKVVAAKAVIGHPLLRSVFEAAALQATFTPFQHGERGIFAKGVIIYKIKTDRTVDTVLWCKRSPIISCGMCNSKAISLPQPEYSPAAKAVGARGKVSVQIVIDENGNVESAKAISGNPLLYAESVKAALKAKFEQTTLSGNPVKVSSTIVYNFVK